MQVSEECSNSCSEEFLTILDSDDTKFEVKIGEAVLMCSGKKPALNQQIYHVIKFCLFLF